MPADLWDAATWPSPSPEPEVRARVHARTKALRRRRTLPVLAAAGAMVAAVAAWPQPTAQTGLATEGRTEDAASVEVGADAGEATTTTTTPAALDRPSGGQVPARVDPSQPGAPVHPGEFPTKPTYSTAHPVLHDSSGDALIETAPARWQSDPVVDIVHLDVTADDEAVTVEVRLADLAASPLSSFTRGRPTSHDYEVSLRREKDSFRFRLYREASGRTTVAAAFWSNHADMGLVDTAGSTYFEGVVGDVDVARDTVRFVAPYRVLNQAVATHAEVHPGAHPPVGRGTAVVPSAFTTARYSGAYDDGPDQVQSTDQTFVYRLGD
ncbi:MAG TPA: hypothetical protein VM938_01365 [Acidimicrobiales bacterium]|nr:hypothetical protein [Acidimicrobiales bacterium]